MADSGYAMDFFISHADSDLQWAEWIAAELEKAGYGVIVKAWDFKPGENLMTRHDEALAGCRHTICVLSAAYVDTEVAARTAAHYQGLAGKERALIPVQVTTCTVPPLMAPIIAIDLCDVDDPGEAQHRLLAGVAGRADRVARGGFPRSRDTRVRFPNARQEVWNLRGHRADPYFLGREDVLAELHHSLRSGSATSAIQVITGLGGLGKTRLVAEYAVLYAAAYDVIWWIRAEDPATMRGDYVELAQELGLPSDKDDQAIAALRRELRRRRDWLLIFDNAEDPEELFPLLPERHSGHVLITSRRQKWPHAETHHLDVLPAPAAARYLQRKGQVADPDTALELADALGCLPLALVQAASVLDDGMRAADYLDLLRRQSPGLFAEGRTPDYEMTIDSTWRVSVDRLARRSPAAIALFRLSAYLAADAIPLARLTATAQMPAQLAEALRDPLLLSKATAALGEYSLADITDGMLSIHRLLQTVTRAELGDDARRWGSIALATIAAAFPGAEQDPKTWEACEDVLPHALACAGHAGRLDIEPIDTVQLLNHAARYLLARGRLDSADAVLAQALTTAEHLDHDHPAYLSYRNTYGRLLLDQGNPSGARAVQEEVYQARIRLLGPEDSDTLRAGRDLVHALYRQGHLAQAAQLNDRLVEAFTAVLGPDHLETITALAYLATILHDAGRYARARGIEEQVVAARARMLGEDHPETLIARGNLAQTLHAMGVLEQARVIAEQVLAARTRIQGEDHPQTLSARGNLGATLYDLGQLKQARVIAEQVLAARIRVLGEEHPDTLDASHNLAVTLRGLGEPDQARVIAEVVLAARTRTQGAEHPQTLAARAGLGAALYDLGQLDQARVIEEQVLEDLTRVLGADHPQTLNARMGLAATLRGLGQLDQARVIEEQVVEDLTRVLGADNPRTLTARMGLAATLIALGELDQARVIAEQVVQILTRMLGAEHSQTLAATALLAAILAAQGNNKEAISLLTECLEIALRVYGKKHTVTTETAWRLVENCGPHERARQQALIVRYLSWLGHEQPDQLSASQKKIKEGIKGPVHGKKQAAHTKKQPARGKRHSTPHKKRRK